MFWRVMVVFMAWLIKHVCQAEATTHLENGTGQPQPRSPEWKQKKKKDILWTVMYELNKGVMMVLDTVT